MKKLPLKIAIAIRDRLWKEADEAGWTSLTMQQKTNFYEKWIKAADVGDVLESYLDGKSVRVYIKDVIMKPYGRARISDPSFVLQLLKVDLNVAVREQFVKPHGRILADGRTIAWGLARDWKSILFAVYERAYRAPKAISYAAVLLKADGKMNQPLERQLVQDAATRLGILKLIWPEHEPNSHDTVKGEHPLLL